MNRIARNGLVLVLVPEEPNFQGSDLPLIGHEVAGYKLQKTGFDCRHPNDVHSMHDAYAYCP